MQGLYAAPPLDKYHLTVQGDLVCGSNNCKKFGAYYHEKDDCCDLPQNLPAPTAPVIVPGTPLTPPPGTVRLMLESGRTIRPPCLVTEDHLVNRVSVRRGCGVED